MADPANMTYGTPPKPSSIGSSLKSADSREPLPPYQAPCNLPTYSTHNHNYSPSELQSEAPLPSSVPPSFPNLQPNPTLTPTTSIPPGPPPRVTTNFKAPAPPGLPKRTIWDDICFAISILLMLSMIAGFIVGGYLLIRPSTISEVYSWGEIQKGSCIRNRVREYSALFINRNSSESGLDEIKRCEKLSMRLNMEYLVPDRCETKNTNETYGYWIVGFSEPSCQSYWGVVTDVGCFSGLRRLEAKLELPWAGKDVRDLWDIMCHSTPAHFYGQVFSTPDLCVSRGELGMFGVWDVLDDKVCRT